MGQKIFVYAIYHQAGLNIEAELNQIDVVDGVVESSTRNSTACRGKDPISDKRTTTRIRLVESAGFEEIDSILESRFDEIWLENIV